MRHIRDLQKQIVLLLFGSCCACIKIDNLFTDLSNALLDLVGRVAARLFATDLFAQPFAIGVQLLKRGFHFSALYIDMQHFVDFRFIAAAACSKSLTNNIRFLPDQTNVEHGADYQRS